MIDYRRITLEEVKNPERFSGDTEFLKDAVAYAVGKTAEIRGEYVHNYPTASSTNLMYGKLGNSVEDIGGDWVTGFWTGMLWLSYELTGDEIYRAIAEAQFDDYKQCCDEPGRIPHHDVGFLYIPSILAQYKLTGNPKAKKLALKAAKVMSRRFAKKAGIIQVRNRDGQGNFIVDCCMNVPLLFWRGLETGDRDYIYMAYSHLCRAIECMVQASRLPFQPCSIRRAAAARWSSGPLWCSSPPGFSEWLLLHCGKSALTDRIPPDIWTAPADRRLPRALRRYPSVHCRPYRSDPSSRPHQKAGGSDSSLRHALPLPTFSFPGYSDNRWPARR